MVYYLFQVVITQSDLGENQLSIQPLLHGIIFKTSCELTEYNFLSLTPMAKKSPQNVISKMFHF